MAARPLTRRGFLAATALSPLLLSGCTVPGFSNVGDDANRDENHIRLWYWNRSIDETLFREFEQSHPGVVIEDQKIGGDYASKFITSLAGQAYVPDIVAMNDDIARYFPNEDQFMDLYELGAADYENLYLPWKWKLGQTTEGKQIGFPMDTGPLALFYRADIFEQAGLPTAPDEVSALFPSWDDYMAAGEELQAKVPGIKMVDNAPYNYVMALMQAKVFYVDENSVYVGDREHVRRAWDVAMQIYQRDLAAKVNPFTPDWSAGVSESGFATFVGAVWMKQFLLESGGTVDEVAGNWRVAQTPGGPGNQGGSFIGITRYAKNPELCFELIRTVQSPENQVRMYSSLSLFPSAIDALRDPVMSVPEDFYGGQPTSEQFIQTAEELEPFYSSPEYAIAHSVVFGQVQDVTVGGGNIEGAWEEAQEQAEREIRHKAPWVKWEEQDV